MLILKKGSLGLRGEYEYVAPTGVVVAGFDVY